MFKTLMLFILVSAATLHAQNEGLWEGYDGEWSHVSRQLIALAEATPAEKFSWRACAEDFVRNLQPYPEPEKTRFWRRLRRLARVRRRPAAA